MADSSPNTSTRAKQKRSGFEKIIEAQQAVLLRAARRLYNNREDQAQDLVQDTLLKGYGAFLENKFEEGTNARAWLLRIMTNLFITDYNRKKKWEADVDFDNVVSEGSSGLEALQAPPADQPEAALVANVMDEPLEKALATLSPDLRVCLVMIDIEEVSYDEAAIALEIPIGTVRSRLFRARQRLHGLLQEYAKQRRR